MRNVVALAVALAACGPSASEIRTAREATYHADPQQLVQLAMAAAREHYPIGAIDPSGLAFMTAPRFYGPEGDLESPGAGGFVTMMPGSVQVSFIVHVVAVGEHVCTVTVDPKTFQLVSGSPKPRELAPDDPYLPPFVTGRADALALAIYQRARPYAVAAPGAG